MTIIGKNPDGSISYLNNDLRKELRKIMGFKLLYM